VSAQTARLAETPSPWGSPAGPGLWHHKGWKLPNYVEQVSKGIMKSGRATTESQAIHMALGVLARWARGGGKVSPEVQAAAAKAIAEFAALRARAAAHSHANDHPVIEFTGDGHGRHIAGTPDVYRHGYIPISGAAKPDAAALRSMSPPEKKAYVKTGAIPDRLKTGSASSAAKTASPARESVPVPATKAALVHHMTEHHSGVPAGGRSVGPRTPTMAQLQANHAKQHEVRSGLDHTHAPAPAADIAEQRRLTAMWTRAFRYSNRTQGTMRDAQFTNELHRLLSTNKPPPKMTPGAQDAHDFLGMVDKGATPQPALYRGISLPPGEAEKMFTPGKTVDLPVASWGKTAGSADAFGGETGVVLQMPPGAKGLDLAPIEHGGGPELEFRTQMQEVVTGGRFTVQSVTTRNGKTYVQLGSQAGFSAH
jgi:hypothetical protein